jgi:hypothetical protein
MAVYHLEIRDFPRNLNRFNMTGQEVGAVLLTWAQERVFEMGDQKWDPRSSELVVLEGPEIPTSGISLGRGWPTALREGHDVTARVLAEAREAIVDGSIARAAQAEEAQDAGPPASDASPPFDEGAGEAAIAAVEGAGSDQLALGVELAALLGPDAPRLLAAWREVASRASGLSPSETLALAERRLRDQQVEPG